LNVIFEGVKGAKGLMPRYDKSGDSRAIENELWLVLLGISVA
jgi:hypothetical protein